MTFLNLQFQWYTFTDFMCQRFFKYLFIKVLFLVYG